MAGISGRLFGSAASGLAMPSIQFSLSEKSLSLSIQLYICILILYNNIYIQDMYMYIYHIIYIHI